MKIAIVGYGRMGHELERLATAKGIEISSIIDPSIKKEGNKFNEVSEESIKDADVCIDFTTPDVAVDNIKKYVELNKNAVIATTGWYDKLDEVKSVVGNKIGLIYSPNFSIGVNLFFRIIKNTAKIFNKFDDYDAFVLEQHHKLKRDSPSGTAQKIGNILIENLNRKSKAVYDKLERKIEPDELHVASVRCGAISGTHIVGFDSKGDIIKLEHEAKSIEGFATGALLAAKWIKAKKGLYTIEDMMKEFIGD